MVQIGDTQVDFQLHMGIHLICTCRNISIQHLIFSVIRNNAAGAVFLYLTGGRM